MQSKWKGMSSPFDASDPAETTTTTSTISRFESACVIGMVRCVFSGIFALHWNVCTLPLSGPTFLSVLWQRWKIEMYLYLVSFVCMRVRYNPGNTRHTHIESTSIHTVFLFCSVVDVIIVVVVVVALTWKCWGAFPFLSFMPSMVVDLHIYPLSVADVTCY